MRLVPFAFTVALATTLTGASAAAQSADSTIAAQSAAAAAAAEAGARDGSIAGRSASVSGVRWSSAAATFFLTPFIGGVAVLARSGRDPDGVPSLVPPPGPLGSSPAYVRAYRHAYRDEYLPRRRHTMRSTMIVTSVVFIAAAAAFSG